MTILWYSQEKNTTEGCNRYSARFISALENAYRGILRVGSGGKIVKRQHHHLDGCEAGDASLRTHI